MDTEIVTIDRLKEMVEAGGIFSTLPNSSKLVDVTSVEPDTKKNQVTIKVAGDFEVENCFSIDEFEGIKHLVCFTQTGNPNEVMLKTGSLVHIPVQAIPAVAQKMGSKSVVEDPNVISLKQVDFDQIELYGPTKNGSCKVTGVNDTEHPENFIGQNGYEKRFAFEQGTSSYVIYILLGLGDLLFYMTTSERSKAHDMGQKTFEKINPNPELATGEDQKSTPPEESSDPEDNSGLSLPDADVSGKINKYGQEPADSSKLTYTNTPYFDCISKTVDHETGEMGHFPLIPELGKPFWVSQDGKIRKPVAHGKQEDGKHIDFSARYLVDEEGNISKEVTSKIPKKYLQTGGIALAAIIILAIVFGILLADGSDNNSNTAGGEEQKTGEQAEGEKGNDKPSITPLILDKQRCSVHENGVNIVLTLKAHVNDAPWVDDANVIIVPQWVDSDSVEITKAEKDHHDGEDFLRLTVNIPKDYRNQHEAGHMLHHFQKME